MKLLLLIFILSFSSQSIGQITFEKRIESNFRDQYFNDTIFDFDENGLIQRSERIKKVNGERIIKYDFYSADLELENSLLFEINYSYGISESISSEWGIHTIFRTNKGEYIIHTINKLSLEQKTTSFNLEKEDRIEPILSVGAAIYFYKKLPSENTELLAINWQNGDIKKIPLRSSNGRLTVRNIIGQKLVTDRRVILIAHFFDYSGPEQQEFGVFHLDDWGNIIRTDYFRVPGINIFTSLDIKEIDNDHFLLTGTFSELHELLPTKGMFVAELEAGALNYLNYYNFSQFKNRVFSPCENKSKIKVKLASMQMYGLMLQDMLFFANHQTILLEDGYLCVADGYYEKTKTTSYYQSGIGGQMNSGQQTVSAGFQFTHAVIAKFDFEGKKIWDQYFETCPAIRTNEVIRLTHLAMDSEGYVDLFFLNEDSLISKTLNKNGSPTINKASVPLKLLNNSDQIKMGYAEVMHWYDNYFLVYGSQVIKNKEEEKKKRSVNFISKIKFE